MKIKRFFRFVSENQNPDWKEDVSIKGDSRIGDECSVCDDDEEYDYDYDDKEYVFSPIERNPNRQKSDFDNTDFDVDFYPEGEEGTDLEDEYPSISDVDDDTLSDDQDLYY